MVILEKLTGKPVVLLLSTIIFVLTIGQIVLSNQLSSSGEKLSKILADIEMFERENRDLKVAVFTKGSISQLKEQAKSLGFAEPKKFFFVKQNFLVAENR